MSTAQIINNANSRTPHNLSLLEIPHQIVAPVKSHRSHFRFNLASQFDMLMLPAPSHVIARRAFNRDLLTPNTSFLDQCHMNDEKKESEDSYRKLVRNMKEQVERSILASKSLDPVSLISNISRYLTINVSEDQCGIDDFEKELFKSLEEEYLLNPDLDVDENESNSENRLVFVRIVYDVVSKLLSNIANVASYYVYGNTENITLLDPIEKKEF